MGYDSLSQWYQVNRILPIDNWHPPVIVYLWRALNVVVNGPLGLLIFQQVLYWAGLGLLVFSFSERNSWKRKIIVLTALGFFPVVWFATASVWKDALMISSLLFSIGVTSLLVKNRLKNAYRPLAVVLILLGLLFAGATRHNGLLAVLPLSTFLFGLILFGSSKMLKQVAFSTLGVGVLLVLSLQVNKVGVQVPYPYLVNQIFLWDVAGISIEKGELLIPESAFNNPDSANLEALTRHYQFASNNSLVFSSELFKDDIWADSEYGKEFLGQSLEVITSELDTYAKVRLRFMSHFVGTGRWMPYLAYIFETKYWAGDEELGLPMYGMNNLSTLRLIETKVLTLFSRVGFYNALPYLGLIFLQFIGLVFWFVRKKETRKETLFLLAICVSGIFYWVPYFVIAPSNDFRYHIWTIEVTMLLLSIFAMRRMSKKSTPVNQ